MKGPDERWKHVGINSTRQAASGIIDWDELHRRLAATQTALDRRLNPGPDENRRLLRARSELLARESEDQESVAESMEVMEFLLAYEHYAIESTLVREICPLMDFTSLPCTPPFVLGLINVRGQILSVIDIKEFFDLPESGLTDLNKVVIIQTDCMELGILADAIVGVRGVALQDLQPSLPTLSGIRVQYLQGVTKDSLVVLDAKKLLSDSRIIVDEDVGGTT